MNVKIKRIHPDAKIPTYATDGSGCFDIYSIDRQVLGDNGDDVFPCNYVYDTGLSFEIPKNHVMLVFSRSGHGFKNNTRLANCVGVIDSDYRGELKVKLTADTHGVLFVEKGDRIAQAMIIPYEQAVFEEVDELSSTERGEGGFGSSGK